MIPARFAVEYPERCLRLLGELEPTARKHELIGSFSILVASSALLIPYERMRSRHPMHRQERDSDLRKALRSLEKKELFLNAGFWSEAGAGDWRFSRVVTSPFETHYWRDDEGEHPMAIGAKNTIAERKAGDVLRVIRNALAHGNLVYLNRHGREEPGTKLEFIAFLSRYEEDEESRRLAETYRLVVTSEENFLHFVKCWTEWISRFDARNGIVAAA